MRIVSWARRWPCAQRDVVLAPSRILPSILAAFSLFLLSACSTLQAPELDNEAPFQGMSALASAATEKQPLEVLIIHGIGTPAPYQFEGFIQSLAQRLRLAQVASEPSVVENSGCYPTDPALPALVHPAPRPISITGVPDEDRAELYTYRFGPRADGPVTLKVNYLLWAPLDRRHQMQTGGRRHQSAAEASLCGLRAGLHRQQAWRCRALRRNVPRQCHAPVRSSRVLPRNGRNAKPRRQDMRTRSL